MSKELLGDLCAFIPAKSASDKNRYPRIGTAFIDSEDKRISLKIDSLPIDGSGWLGWVNIFPPKGPKPVKPDIDEDDEPF